MIGDDIVGDVQGAQLCGLRGVLVRTGKYRLDLYLLSATLEDGPVQTYKLDGTQK